MVVLASPLKRMPAVPLSATILLTTTAPGASRPVSGLRRLAGTPGWGTLLVVSRTPASMLMP